MSRAAAGPGDGRRAARSAWTSSTSSRAPRRPGATTRYEPDGRRVGVDEFEVLGLTHHDLDVGDPVAVRRAVAVTQPDVIVHLAAYTAVDRAEAETDECFAVNAGGTAAMSEAAREFGAHLITVSTDYVFDGEKGAAYVETDATNPLNVYGASKYAGELAVGPRTRSCARRG